MFFSPFRSKTERTQKEAYKTYDNKTGKKWKSDGNKLILWTCRIGDALSNAVDWCQSHGLEFDAVNDNLPEIIEYYGSNSRKITCDWYIDDRNMIFEKMEA